MVKLITNVKVFEIDLESGNWMKSERKVAVEEPLFVYVNGQHLVTLMSTPNMKKELALGHLITEGWINSLSRVKEVRVRNSRVDITLINEMKGSRKFSKNMVPAVDTTSQAVNHHFLKALEPAHEKLKITKKKLDAAKIYAMACEFEEKCEIHKETRGTHSAAIFLLNGKLISFAEDVGRHNAVDKTVGDALLKQTDLSEGILFSSGRQSAYMVLKAARAHIPFIVSLATPLESGVKVAEKAGLTLISISGKHVIIYTNSGRLKL